MIYLIIRPEGDGGGGDSLRLISRVRTFASGRGVVEAAIAKRRRATHSNLKNTAAAPHDSRRR